MRVLNFVIDAAVATTTNSFKQLAQLLYITNGNASGAAKQVPACRFLDIVPNTVTKKVAVASQTNGTGTVTPLAGASLNGITYAILITQLNILTGTYYTNTYTVTTPVSGTITATTISAQLILAVNADPNIHVLASASGATMLLTAEAGYATFGVTIITIGEGLTYTAGTAGVYIFGVTPYTALLIAGLTTPTDFIGSTAGYTRYQWIANVPITPTDTMSTSQPVQFNVFVNQDNAAGTQSTDLITAIDAIWAQAAFATGTVKLL